MLKQLSLSYNNFGGMFSLIIWIASAFYLPQMGYPSIESTKYFLTLVLRPPSPWKRVNSYLKAIYVYTLVKTETIY
jgi:hypothetical protein